MAMFSLSPSSRMIATIVSNIFCAASERAIDTVQLGKRVEGRGDLALVVDLARQLERLFEGGGARWRNLQSQARATRAAGAALRCSACRPTSRAMARLSSR
jgi:hypothetical protein